MKILHRILCFSVCLSTLCVTGSYAQSKPNNLTLGTYKTIFEMLRDVPGLEVKLNNTRPGGSVTVRGTGSLTSQKPPLFVVDGAVYNGDITNINTQDVEAISVLKDAASATAYGAQGAGGVIMITTKKGQGATAQAVVASHNESAYAYFISRKTPLKIIGMDDELITEGVIHMQRDSVLVFIKKRKELLVPVKKIKRVEMIVE